MSDVTDEDIKQWFDSRTPFFDGENNISAGQGVEITDEGVWGYDFNEQEELVKQAGFGTDGKWIAGAGRVIADEDGLRTYNKSYDEENATEQINIGTDGKLTAGGGAIIIDESGFRSEGENHLLDIDEDGLEINTDDFTLQKNGDAKFGGELKANIVNYEKLDINYAKVEDDESVYSFSGIGSSYGEKDDYNLVEPDDIELLYTANSKEEYNLIRFKLNPRSSDDKDDVYQFLMEHNDLQIGASNHAIRLARAYYDDVDEDDSLTDTSFVYNGKWFYTGSPFEHFYSEHFVVGIRTPQSPNTQTNSGALTTQIDEFAYRIRIKTGIADATPEDPYEYDDGRIFDGYLYVGFKRHSIN